MSKTIFIDKNIEVIIVSAGGVGTTFLMKEIAKYKTTNCSSNSDGIKHSMIPPISKNKKLKVIYVFGDPIMACISLFRRNYHFTQSKAVQKFQKKKHITPYEKTLNEYVQEKKDNFLFENHLNNWNTRFTFYPTLFVKYETLFNNIDKVSDFLEMPEEFRNNFPEKKKRFSSIENIPIKTKEGLKLMYGKLSKEIDQMPEISLKTKGKKVSLFKLYFFFKDYRNAFITSYLYNNPVLRKILNKLNINLIESKR